MLTVRRAASKDYFRAGFYSSLGVAALALLAWFAWQIFSAAIAISVPFLVGFALALLLDPLADRLEKHGIPRLWASLLVFGIFLLLAIGFGYVVIPALINEAASLKDTGPQAIGQLSKTVNHWLKTHPHFAGVKMPRNFHDLSDELSVKAATYFNASTGGLQAFLQSAVGAVLSTVITLIVAFFLLRDIDKLRARFFYLLPDRARAPLEQLGDDIGGVFSDYLRGLLIVCTLYGVCTIVMLYSLSFFKGHSALAGYALLLGAIAGALYAVPYLGSTTTALITFLVAFAAGGVSLGIWAVALTLALNQIFDNIVTPKVVGGGVGLHPALAIFALILGARLYGIWGMLLSVPIAASIQMILFRVFPKLTTSTPPVFLRVQGVPRSEVKAASETSKSGEGEDPQLPLGPSLLHEALRGGKPASKEANESADDTEVARAERFEAQKNI